MSHQQYRGGQTRVQRLATIRALRRRLSDAERRLWRALRSGQLEGHKFRRQHEFGRFVLDFYCPAARLVIEVDGGQHYSEAGLAHDQQRTKLLEAHGLRVLRFSNVDVLTQLDAVLATILSALGD